ncbi:hypothetical protein RhiLY_11294 [Ceratobasidium sp. AG-Ba]|nr:hypothetical protein RhiLY_04976 [Ceratobasidium sp. AG-Ba]QRW12295.1 hypothetical protein RhiLY_11294 [Ceratobasidium sp. AG-Ba]
MKLHEYCCCAIPILNVGIYTVIGEQFILAVVAGTLSIATPFIVGASVPSFAPWLLAIACYVVAGVQTLGFIGVFKEKAGLFRKYVMINSVAVLAAFGIAAAFIAISGTKHDKASSRCQRTFFATSNPSAASSNDDSGEGAQICEVFTWVILGLMGGLWVTLLSFQSYLLLVTRFYSQSQRADHKKYYTIYSTLDIPLNDRQNSDNDAWVVRPSTDSWHAGAAMGANDAQYHRRQNSGVSYADDEKYDTTEPAYGVRRTLAEPHRAVTEEPGPTPYAGGFAQNQGGAGYYGDVQDLQRPEQQRYHPGS